MIAAGNAPKVKQTEVGATYDPAMFKEENQVINLDQSALRIFNFVRALDSVPGAITYVLNESGEEETVRLFGASLVNDLPKNVQEIKFKGVRNGGAFVHDGGIIITGNDGKYVNIQRIKKGSRVISASKWFEQNVARVPLELTPEEKQMEGVLRGFWESILKVEVDGETDFFACGAGSMDVVRLVEEAKDAFEIHLENETLLMSPVFSEFFEEVVKAKRYGNTAEEITVPFEGFVMKANKREIPVPTQLFINGSFKPYALRSNLGFDSQFDFRFFVQVNSSMPKTTKLRT